MADARTRSTGRGRAVLASLAGVLVAAATGALAGLAGSLLCLSIPGLVLGLALTVAAAVLSAAHLGRPGSGSALVGWLLVVLTASLGRPEGDVVIPASGLGYAWLLGGTVLSGLVVGLGPLAVPRRLRPPDEPPVPPAVQPPDGPQASGSLPSRR